MSKKAIFNVYLGQEQVLEYYRGTKQAVRAQTDDGQSISVPFNILLEFVTHEGIAGTFELHFEDDGKFKKIRKIR